MFYFESSTGCNDHGSRRCLSMQRINLFGYQPSPRDSYLHVLIANTKTNISRSFAIIEEAFSVNAVEICQKYINLLPKTADGRFFLRYVDGKCTTHQASTQVRKLVQKRRRFLDSLIQKVLPDMEWGALRQPYWSILEAILPLSSATEIGSRVQ